MTEAMRTALEQLADLLPASCVHWQVPMATMTTLKLGGPADLVLEPETPEQAADILRLADTLQVPCMPVGRGSNLLVRDGGVRGCILSTKGLKRLTVEGHTATAGAGVALATLSRTAAEHGLAGLTFAAGIPGSVGGAVKMNAGAYGGEMSQVVRQVRGYTRQGAPFCLSNEAMDFRHRHSRLMEEDLLVTEVDFMLSDGEPEALLREAAELNARRREKQPLELPSAGSTFKRPPNGYASAMIDACGLKGLQVGGAQVSTKHAGFCVNLGGTSHDFLQLMEQVQSAVQQRFGVLLEPEVCVIGEEEEA